MTSVDNVNIIVYAVVFLCRKYSYQEIIKMKTRKILSTVLAIVFALTVLPAISIAEEDAEDRIIAVHYYGDANLNDYLNTLDATIILKINAELLDPTIQQTAMTYELVRKIDANKDGKLNTADASYVLQVAAGTRHANEYYETASGNPPVVPSAEPTIAPTSASTSEPTADPSGNPNPTVQPTALPTAEPDAYVTVKYYDIFNEMNGVDGRMGVYEGMNEITAENIEFPAGSGYVPADPNLYLSVSVTDGVPTPAEIYVNVIPMAKDNMDNVYTIVYTLNGFNKINDDLKSNYALGADIDLGGENRMPFGADWEDDTQPDKMFEGIFHGNSHMIYNLCIDHTHVYNEEDGTYDAFEDVGLFALNKGTICNLIVFTSAGYRTNEYGVFGDSNVGVIAGENGGIIKDCYVFGNVGAMDCFDQTHGGAGGICGVNYGIVTRCSFEGGAEGFYWIGGICGKNYGKISECYFAGGINAGASDEVIEYYEVMYIGGICGGSENGDVRNCYVYCASRIFGYNAVGGMIGWLKGGHFHSSFIVKSRVDYMVTDGGHDDVGALVSMPFFSGLYYSNNESMSMKPEFGSEWDMNGASHSTFPDLVNHRRFDQFYID